MYLYKRSKTYRVVRNRLHSAFGNCEENYNMMHIMELFSYKARYNSNPATLYLIENRNPEYSDSCLNHGMYIILNVRHIMPHYDLSKLSKKYSESTTEYVAYKAKKETDTINQIDVFMNSTSKYKSDDASSDICSEFSSHLFKYAYSKIKQKRDNPYKSWDYFLMRNHGSIRFMEKYYANEFTSRYSHLYLDALTNIAVAY
jgi:hypothetical protein